MVGYAFSNRIDTALTLAALRMAVKREMKMILPVRSELFVHVVCLSDKLEKEKIDYAYEMSAVGLSDDEIA